MSASPGPGHPTPPSTRFRRNNGIGLFLVLCLVAAIVAIMRPRSKTESEPPATEQSAPIESEPSPAPEKRPETDPVQNVGAVDTNSPEAQLVAQLLNPFVPLKTRRQAARALAKVGSDTSMSALRTALQDGPPYLKAAIGEGLGESPHREAREVLMDLINGTDETAARGAVRGLAMKGDVQAAEVLSNILFNDKKPESVRTEAALALGEVQQPAALSALIRATAEIQDPAIIEQVLEGLGRRPFTETEPFFREYLDSPGLSAESKVAALEALGNTTGDIASLALKYTSDSDPDIRAAAAWALSATETHSDIAPQLLDLLKGETVPEVRAKLYEALGGQENLNSLAVLTEVQKETDATARQAGLGILAELCHSAPTAELLAYFKQTAVPELENRALTGTDLQQRLDSVMSLRRAGIPESLTALQQIVQQSTERKIVDAAQAALRVNAKK